MSLIDEALKRARMEAAQRAAEGEGLPYPAIPRHLGPRRRRAWLAPLMLTAAVIAGLVLGLTVASRGEPDPDQVAAVGARESTATEAPTIGPAVPEPAPAAPADLDRTAFQPGPAVPGAEPPGPPVELASEPPPPTTTASSGGPPAAAVPAPANPEETTGSPPAAPSQVSEPRRRPAPTPLREAPSAVDPPVSPPRPVAPPSTGITSSDPAVPPVTRSAPQAAPDPAKPEAVPSTVPLREPVTVSDRETGVLLVLPDRSDQSEPTPDTETAVAAEIEAYVQQLPLPDGGTIELGGIAWSETGPYALINGRVLGPGTLIEGYTLERIRPSSVILVHEGRRVEISLQ